MLKKITAALILSGSVSCFSGAEIEEVASPIGLPQQDKRDKSLPACQKITASDYRLPGPFKVITEELEDGEVKVWRPVSTDQSCQYPLAHFSNGTFKTCRSYDGVMAHMSTWGFIVGCYESQQTGSGKQCTEGLSLMTDKYRAELLPLIASVGHSQGGAGAIACLHHLENTPEWKDLYRFSGAAIYPAHGMGWPTWRGNYPNIKSPIYVMSASLDIVVNKTWVQTGFEKLKRAKPRYWMEAVGATHQVYFPWAGESITSWARSTLLDDYRAKRYFVKLSKNRYWRLKSKK